MRVCTITAVLLPMGVMYCDYNHYTIIIIIPQIKANNYDIIMSSVSSGEDSLKIIQEDQEPDNDQQPIKVCTLCAIIWLFTLAQIKHILVYST